MRRTTRAKPGASAGRLLAVLGAVLLVGTARRARAAALAGRSAAPPVTADDGVELHVEVAGRADAELTVVLIHGYGATLREWRGQRDALAPHARLVLYDQRGHGRSSWGHHRRATLDQLGPDLLSILPGHADDRPVLLVGHSRGGMTVLALAESHPELFGDRVVGVALLSTSAGHLMETGLPAGVARAARRLRALAPLLWLLWVIAPVVDRCAPLTTATGRRFLRRRLFGWQPPTADELDAAQRDLTTTRQSVLAAFAPSLLHHERAPALRVLTGLPVLVLTGSSDATIPAAHSERLRQELQGQCELVVVAGAGHLVNVTHPDEVNSALLRLLRTAGRHCRWTPLSWSATSSGRRRLLRPPASTSRPSSRSSTGSASSRTSWSTRRWFCPTAPPPPGDRGRTVSSGEHGLAAGARARRGGHGRTADAPAGLRRRDRAKIHAGRAAGERRDTRVGRVLGRRPGRRLLRPADRHVAGEHRHGRARGGPGCGGRSCGGCWRPAAFLLVSLLGEVAVYLVVSRLVVDRARPPAADSSSPLPDLASFPSGHAAAAMTLYGVIALVVHVHGHGRWRRVVPVVPVVLGVLVTLGRLYRGVHYPTDVLASALLSVGWLTITYQLLMRRPRPDR